MTKPTVTDMMRAYAEDAIDFANQLNIELDFSEESLNKLDLILQQFHDGIPKGLKKLFKKGPSEEQIAQMSKMWGGYLGETIIRMFGGEWIMSKTFENAIAIQVQGTEIYPPAKTYKRIVNGQEDNIVNYYKVLKHDFAS